MTFYVNEYVLGGGGEKTSHGSYKTREEAESYCNGQPDNEGHELIIDDDKVMCTGFKKPVARLDPDQYQTYCVFHYTINGSTVAFPTANGIKVESHFPPIGRNDIYGGLTETEIRSLAMDRLSELEKLYTDVTAEIVTPEQEYGHSHT